MKHIIPLFISISILTTLSYLYIDRDVAVYFSKLSNENFKGFFHFMTRFGKSEWYLIPSILLFWYFRKREHREYAKMAWYIFMTNVVAGLGVWLFKFPFGRARPKLFLNDGVYGFQWFEIDHKLTSFPSGHTITAISTAVALSLLFPKYRFLFISFGVIVAFSRVVGLNHYLSDVLFASFLGSMVPICLYRYYYFMEQRCRDT